jgi:hypothetical protein
LDIWEGFDSEEENDEFDIGWEQKTGKMGVEVGVLLHLFRPMIFRPSELTECIDCFTFVGRDIGGRQRRV